MKEDPFKEFETVKSISLNTQEGSKNSIISLRLDPLFGKYSPHSASISEERAKRPENIKHVRKETKQEGCIFCEPKIYEVTPSPRIDHSREGMYTPKGKPILSVPNLYPFSPDHYVTVFADHKPDIIDLLKEDLVNYIETAFYFANKFRAEKAEGMWDFINWGASAGASQPHPHAQRGTLEKQLNSMITLEQVSLAKRAKDISKDPFEIYMSKVRESPYFIFENDFLFICAPFAPKFADQVDIISKKGFNTLLDTSWDYRRGLAESMIGVFHALGNKRGVDDFNLTLHQNFFEVKDFYRLHWHVYPRNKSNLGGMELNNSYVVGVFPQVTAKALREHFGVKGYD
ncbi:MAG: hypothetical protein Q8N77_01165 [Nanoarchaeota archaeon]|nr:hypothetical protein [Nanoarchaeota archaeon]